MSDVRAPWLVVYGMAVLGCFVIGILMIGDLVADIADRRPQTADPNSGDVWLVLDEARRITQQAAAEES